MPAEHGALAREGHYGLANMRERANKVGGRVQIVAAPGRGTRIELTVHAGEEIEPWCRGEPQGRSR
jgi:signal transduction histidine kinase